MKQNKPQKKRPNKAIQLSGAGLQMGVTIYAGFLLGGWLDKKFEINFLTGVRAPVFRSGCIIYR